MPRQVRSRLTLRAELALALRAAARNIADAKHRDIAADQAKKIPKTVPERYGRGWGQEAGYGRALMRELPDLPKDQWESAANALRNYAHVVEKGRRDVSEVSLSDRQRRFGGEGR